MFIAVILTVMISFTACKTQKSLSKQKQFDMPIYAVDTSYQNASTEMLTAILAEEKKSNGKVKNNWYPIPKSQTLPGELVEEKNVMPGLIIFNFYDYRVMPDQDAYVPPPPYSDYNEYDRFGTSLSSIDKSWLWLIPIIAAIAFLWLVIGKNRHSPVVDVPSFTNMITALQPGGGKFNYQQNGITINVEVNMVPKEEVKKVPDTKA